MESLRRRAHSTGWRLTETRLRCERITKVTGVASKLFASSCNKEQSCTYTQLDNHVLLMTRAIERQTAHCCMPEIFRCLQSDDAVEKSSIPGEGIVDVAKLGIGGFSSGEGSSSRGWGLGLSAIGGGQFGVHCSREYFMDNGRNRRFICSGAWLQPRAHGAMASLHVAQRTAALSTQPIDSPSIQNVWYKNVKQSKGSTQADTTGHNFP